MPEVEYDLPLGPDARKRHYHRTERGQVVDFMVQLEVWIDDGWKEVIRYDCAHGFAHVDRYNLVGARTKDNLDLDYGDALTLADTSINEN